jgi:hypothetical protein
MPDREARSAATTEPPVGTAKRIVTEIDTYGDPRLYALAKEYLSLREVVDFLLPANGCHTVDEALAAFSAGTFRLGKARKK